MIYIFLLIVVVSLSNIEIQLSQNIFLNIEPAIISLIWFALFLRVCMGTEFRVDKLLKTIIVFFVLALASNIINTISANMGYKPAIVSTAYLLQFVVYISIPFLATFYARSQKDIENCLRVMLLCYAIVLLYNVYLLSSGSADIYAGDYRHLGLKRGRLSGFWNFNSNTLAGYIALHVMLCVYILCSSSNRAVKSVVWILVAISLMVLPFTFSRESLLALIAGLGILIAFSERRRNIIMNILVPVCLLSVLVGFSARDMVSACIDRFASTFHFLQKGKTVMDANVRLPLWKSIISESSAGYHLLYGHGFFRKLVDSTYLSVLHSAGIFGLLSFLYFLGIVAKKIYVGIRSRENNLMYIIALSMFAQFLIYAAVGDMYANKRILIPLFIFLGLCFRNTDLTEDGAKEASIVPKREQVVQTSV